MYVIVSVALLPAKSSTFLSLVTHKGWVDFCHKTWYIYQNPIHTVHISVNAISAQHINCCLTSHKVLTCNAVLGKSFKTCVLALCWKQAKRVFQSISTSPTARWMRSFPICLAVLKKTVALWRDLRESGACCGQSWHAGCWVVRFSTNLSTKSKDHSMQTAVKAFRCFYSAATCSEED